MNIPLFWDMTPYVLIKALKYLPSVKTVLIGYTFRRPRLFCTVRRCNNTFLFRSRISNKLCLLVKKTNLVHNLFLLHLCLSISTCFGRLWAHLREIQLCLCDTWYLLFGVNDCPPCIPDSHPHRITSSKCRINTVVSPEDGPIVARNMWRLININVLRINCAPSWFYLQDYTEMQVNKTLKNIFYVSFYCTTSLITDYKYTYVTY